MQNGVVIAVYISSRVCIRLAFSVEYFCNRKYKNTQWKRKVNRAQSEIEHWTQSLLPPRANSCIRSCCVTWHILVFLRHCKCFLRKHSGDIVFFFYIISWPRDNNYEKIQKTNLVNLWPRYITKKQHKTNLSNSWPRDITKKKTKTIINSWPRDISKKKQKTNLANIFFSVIISWPRANIKEKHHAPSVLP